MEGQRWSHEKLVATKLEEAWYFMSKWEAQYVFKIPDQMRRILAKELKVLPEEINLRSSADCGVETGIRDSGMG
jgi:hypothetical protein